MIETAALIIIGTELTRGIIQDQHAQFVSHNLTEIGLHISQIVSIPDDGSIESILQAIVKKNDVVIITGGLGPTSDDMTRECIADIAGVSLVRNEESYNALYARMGERLHGANEKQTMLPEGFERIPNPNGTADGFYGYTPGKSLIVALPGPPREMRPMFDAVVLPLLSRLSGHSEEVRREYSTFIIAEARLEELTHSIAPSLVWGTRFQDYKITLYLSGGSEEEKDEAIAKLRSATGNELVVEGNTTTRDELVKLLEEKGLTLSCAESCTGGLASSLLTKEAGASSFFLGSVVSYSNSMKERVLGVSEETIKNYGAVSEECAGEMAEGARRLADSDYAFSITGVAGPGESESKKAGTVCFGFASRDRVSTVRFLFSTWGRASVQKKSANTAFILMKAFIEGQDVKAIAESWQNI